MDLHQPGHAEHQPQAPPNCAPTGKVALHSHIALHPCSLLYHQATLPPDYLQAAAHSGQLLDPAFWKRHLPTHIATTYCEYLALETKHARNKQQDSRRRPRPAH